MGKSSPSPYERLQIASLLQIEAATPVVRGSGLILLPESPEFLRIHEIGIGPAFRKCEMSHEPFVRVFDSDSALVDVTREIASAEVIVADLSEQPAHLLYVLGLCHAMGRCPLLLTRAGPNLPFNLASLRFVEYADTHEGLIRLREDLARALRVFLIATRSGGTA